MYWRSTKGGGEEKGDKTLPTKIYNLKIFQANNTEWEEWRVGLSFTEIFLDYTLNNFIAFLQAWACKI